MKKFKNWIIAIIIGVLLTIIVATACLVLLNRLYTRRYTEQNRQVEEYASITHKETQESMVEQETTSSVSIEEIEIEETSEDIIYWDPDDDRDQVYFSDSSKITTQGFLPYDVLGPLNLFLREKLRNFGDSSREMIIDDSTQNDKVSVIFFHTNKGSYTYRYDWENNTQELLED